MLGHFIEKCYLTSRFQGIQITTFFSEIVLLLSEWLRMILKFIDNTCDKSKNNQILYHLLPNKFCLLKKKQRPTVYNCGYYQQRHGADKYNSSKKFSLE